VIKLTDIRLNQDGASIMVGFGDRGDGQPLYGAMIPLDETTERVIEEFHAKLELNTEIVTDLKRKLVSRVITGDFSPKPVLNFAGKANGFA
jgi:hypothetical protein